MRNIEDIKTILKSRKEYLQRRYKVKKIAIFGSYVSGNQDDNSDIDIYIEFREPLGLEFFELVEYLEKILGNKVDIITPGGLRSIYNENIADNIRGQAVYV